MIRWNEVGPKYAVASFWYLPMQACFDAFPHPTFKGGSNEAYTTFAKALVEFLGTGNNFEFMDKNDLFTMERGLRSGLWVGRLGFEGGWARPDPDAWPWGARAA